MTQILDELIEYLHRTFLFAKLHNYWKVGLIFSVPIMLLHVNGFMMMFSGFGINIMLSGILSKIFRYALKENNVNDIIHENNCTRHDAIVIISMLLSNVIVFFLLRNATIYDFIPR